MSNEIPRYQCHKRVRAFKIKEVAVEHGQIGYTLIPTDARLQPVWVSTEFVAKHSPMAGSYFVRYDDGYESVSPAKAFEEGYTLVS